MTEKIMEYVEVPYYRLKVRVESAEPVKAGEKPVGAASWEYEAWKRAKALEAKGYLEVRGVVVEGKERNRLLHAVHYVDMAGRKWKFICTPEEFEAGRRERHVCG